MSVVLENLGHTFDGEHFLFQNLNFEFTQGKIYALTGPSGSGKSTLLAIISQMLKPTTGNLNLGNAENIRWVFQNPHGVPNRTALDHLALPLIARGLNRHDAEQVAAEYVSKFKLQAVANKAFSKLSGGEAQRLMLARALASTPDILLVDEPTAQLDFSTAMTVADVLKNAAQEGTITIIATHDENVRNSCDCVVDLSAFAAAHTPR